MRRDAHGRPLRVSRLRPQEWPAVRRLPLPGERPSWRRELLTGAAIGAAGLVLLVAVFAGLEWVMP